MSTFVDNKQGTKVYIPEVELQQPENYMVYQIAVEVGPVSWRVPHRYRDFVELHDKLVADHGVTKDLLPPKKVIGNRDPVFVEKRRSALEMYLASVLTFLLHTMPRELALFLDFHKYDILFILQEMAVNFFEKGDEYLRSSKHYELTPLQVGLHLFRFFKNCISDQFIFYRMFYLLFLASCHQ